MPTSPTRRMAVLAVGAACAAVLACGAFAATGRLTVAGAAALAAAAVTLAALAVLAALVRGLTGQLTRVERRLRQHLEAGDARTTAALRGLRSDVTTLVRRTATIEAQTRALEQGRRIDFRQAEALTELRALLSPRAPMPASRGWAASPDVLLALAEQVLRRRPKLVVECGSGASSVWLGYAVERAGEGRVVALEHDERYADLTRDLVTAHGLDAVVEVRTAPLRPWPSPDAAHPGDAGDADASGDSGEPGELWYDTEVLADLTGIGLLFVDGPPGRGGPLARYPAGPELLARCGPDAMIVLDDTIREAERTISDRWLTEYPDLHRTEHPYEKGAHIFTRHPA
ncbi:MAG: class I SAM-dependent methyltransferase [Streptosporangiales bacterium]|nr:class I SAM-dependent methyltransferase [Streptosporangiales bacterium]